MLSPTDIDKDNVIQVVVGCKSDLSSDRKVSPEMGQAQYLHKDSITHCLGKFYCVQ